MMGEPAAMPDDIEEMKTKTHISREAVERLQRALEHESPRGMIIVTISWIDYMLDQRFSREFSAAGQKDTISAKLKAARRADLIDDELYDDLEILRDIRNRFAHKVEPCSSDAEEIRTQLQRLKTPERIYSDWGEIKTAETDSGFILYSGEKPAEALQDLRLPGLFALKMGLPAVIGVLSEALNVVITVDEGRTEYQ